MENTTTSTPSSLRGKRARTGGMGNIKNVQEFRGQHHVPWQRVFQRVFARQSEGDPPGACQVGPPFREHQRKCSHRQQQRETYSTARPGAPLREVSRIVQLSGVYLFGSQPLVPTIGAAEFDESSTGEVPLAVAMVSCSTGSLRSRGIQQVLNTSQQSELM